MAASDHLCVSSRQYGDLVYFTLGEEVLAVDDLNFSYPQFLPRSQVRLPCMMLFRLQAYFEYLPEEQDDEYCGKPFRVGKKCSLVHEVLHSFLSKREKSEQAMLLGWKEVKESEGKCPTITISQVSSKPWEGFCSGDSVVVSVVHEGRKYQLGKDGEACFKFSPKEVRQVRITRFMQWTREVCARVGFVTQLKTKKNMLLTVKPNLSNSSSLTLFDSVRKLEYSESFGQTLPEYWGELKAELTSDETDGNSFWVIERPTQLLMDGVLYTNEPFVLKHVVSGRYLGAEFCMTTESQAQHFTFPANGDKKMIRLGEQHLLMEKEGVPLKSRASLWDLLLQPYTSRLRAGISLHYQLEEVQTPNVPSETLVTLEVQAPSSSLVYEAICTAVQTRILFDMHGLVEKKFSDDTSIVLKHVLTRIEESKKEDDIEQEVAIKPGLTDNTLLLLSDLVQQTGNSEKAKHMTDVHICTDILRLVILILRNDWQQLKDNLRTFVFSSEMVWNQLYANGFIDFLAREYLGDLIVVLTESLPYQHPLLEDCQGVMHELQVKLASQLALSDKLAYIVLLQQLDPASSVTSFIPPFKACYDEHNFFFIEEEGTTCEVSDNERKLVFKVAGVMNTYPKFQSFFQLDCLLESYRKLDSYRQLKSYRQQKSYRLEPYRMPDPECLRKDQAALLEFVAEAHIRSAGKHYKQHAVSSVMTKNVVEDEVFTDPPSSDMQRDMKQVVDFEVRFWGEALDVELAASHAKVLAALIDYRLMQPEEIAKTLVPALRLLNEVVSAYIVLQGPDKEGQHKMALERLRLGDKSQFQSLAETFYCVEKPQESVETWVKEFMSKQSVQTLSFEERKSEPLSSESDGMSAPLVPATPVNTTRALFDLVDLLKRIAKNTRYRVSNHPSHLLKLLDRAMDPFQSLANYLHSMLPLSSFEDMEKFLFTESDVTDMKKVAKLCKYLRPLMRTRQSNIKAIQDCLFSMDFPKVLGRLWSLIPASGEELRAFTFELASFYVLDNPKASKEVFRYLSERTFFLTKEYLQLLDHLHVLRHDDELLTLLIEAIQACKTDGVESLGTFNVPEILSLFSESSVDDFSVMQRFRSRSENQLVLSLLDKSTPNLVQTELHSAREIFKDSVSSLRPSLCFLFTQEELNEDILNITSNVFMKEHLQQEYLQSWHAIISCYRALLHVSAALEQKSSQFAAIRTNKYFKENSDEAFSKLSPFEQELLLSQELELISTERAKNIRKRWPTLAGAIIAQAVEVVCRSSDPQLLEEALKVLTACIKDDEDAKQILVEELKELQKYRSFFGVMEKLLDSVLDNYKVRNKEQLPALLAFLKLIQAGCDGCFASFQNYLREQTANEHQCVDLVDLMADALEDLLSPPNHVVLPEVMPLAKSLACTLQEAASGPCTANVEEICWYPRLLNGITSVLLKGTENPSPLEEWPQLAKLSTQEVHFYKSLVGLMAALMEGNERMPEVLEKLIPGVRFEDFQTVSHNLVDIRNNDEGLFKSLETGTLRLDEHDDEHSKSARAGAIFTLAMKSFLVYVASRPEGTQPDSRLMEYVGSVEVEVSSLPGIRCVLFPLPFKSLHSSQQVKEDILTKLSSPTREENLEQFVGSLDAYMKEMSYLQSLSRWPIYAVCKHWEAFFWLGYVLLVLLNIVLLLEFDKVSQSTSESYRVWIMGLGTAYSFYRFLATLCYYVFYWNHVMTPLQVQDTPSCLKQIMLVQNSGTAKSLKVSETSSASALRKTRYRLVIFALVRVALIPLSVWAIFRPWLFSFFLLEIAFMVPAISNIIKALSDSFSKLISTFGFSLIILYLFAMLGFFFFNFYFTKDGSCKSLVECFLTTLNFGMRSGGGIGDVLSTPNPEDLGYRLVFDMAFYVCMTTILIAIIFGIVVDAFGKLRDEETEREKNLASACPICKQSLSTIEIQGEGWDKHCVQVHNPFAYLCFMTYVKEKALNKCSGVEKIVRLELDRKGYRFFPTSSRALSK